MTELFAGRVRHTPCLQAAPMEQHPKSDQRVMGDIGDAFAGGAADDQPDNQTDAHTGQTPPDELARLREKADAEIGEGGETGMSGAESGYGVTGESSGLDSTAGSDLSDEGLDPTGENA